MFRNRATRLQKDSRRTHLRLERLETRTLFALNPLQVQHAYGFDATTLYDTVGNAYAADGSGQTIAIVIWYDDPNIASDLAHFDATYGIPDPPSFQKAFPQGQPQGNTSNGEEISLDVEYSHAMAPGANILLVEARTNSTSDLYGAIDYARNYPGVSVVSMSWGGSDVSSDVNLNYHFTTPGGHNGVSFIAASGDTGGTRIYPAMSPNVVAVGGTNLSLYSNGDYRSESGASFSGGGQSSYEPEPDSQRFFQNSGRRQGPDVAYVGAVRIYDTYGFSGFLNVSGTSVGAPQWAGLTAIIDEQMNLYGYDTLDGPGQLLPTLYGLAQNNNYPFYDGQDFHDVQTGGSRAHPCTLGFDESTGLGTPIVYNLVPDAVAYLTGLSPAVSHLRPKLPASSSSADVSALASVPEAGAPVVTSLHTTGNTGVVVLPAADALAAWAVAAAPVDQGAVPVPVGLVVTAATAPAHLPVGDVVWTSGTDLSGSTLDGEVLLA